MGRQGNEEVADKVYQSEVRGNKPRLKATVMWDNRTDDNVYKRDLNRETCTIR